MSSVTEEILHHLQYILFLRFTIQLAILNVEYENVRNKYSTFSLYGIKGSSKSTVFVYLKAKKRNMFHFHHEWEPFFQPTGSKRYIYFARGWNDQASCANILRWRSCQVFPRQHYQIWRYDHDYHRGVGSGPKNERLRLDASVSSFPSLLTKSLSFPERSVLLCVIIGNAWFEKQYSITIKGHLA